MKTLYFCISLLIIGAVFSCKKNKTQGCTNPIAENYNPNAEEEDGSCKIRGCIDPLSANYHPQANQADDSCIYNTCPDKRDINYSEGSKYVDMSACDCKKTLGKFLGSYHVYQTRYNLNFQETPVQNEYDIFIGNPTCYEYRMVLHNILNMDGMEVTLQVYEYYSTYQIVESKQINNHNIHYMQANLSHDTLFINFRSFLERKQEPYVYKLVAVRN